MITENKTHLYVDNYGELLAQVNDMKLVSFKTENSYQGEYCAILTDGKRLFYYVDRYGSCSGCDWLEDENIYEGNDESKRYRVLYKNALDYCGELKPKYIVPKSLPLKIKTKGKYYNGFDIKK